MSSNIFLIGSDNALTELTRSSYDSEVLLQRLIADHPALLGSATGADGGLLLIQREHSVPDALDGNGRWSLDHLFLDRNAVPTLVEVKRATDTRARREVVAQMLDYAANGVAYWPIDGIIEAFRTSCEAGGIEPEARLAEFLGDMDPEAFWRATEANLRSGRIRMVFLADEIGKELRRIVEFLNEQMRPAEVLAVEVVQYVSPTGVRTLVPKLVGATERAQSAKSITTEKEPIDEETWLALLAEVKGHEARAGAERAIAWIKANGFAANISKSQDSIYAPITLPNGRMAFPFFLRKSTGNFEISLFNLKNTRAYAKEEDRRALLERLKASVPGMKTTMKANGWPSVPLSALLQDDVWLPLQPFLIEIRNTLE